MQPKWIVRDSQVMQNLVEHLQSLDLTKPLEVIIQPYRKKRTLSQNSMYWAEINQIVSHVVMHTGYTADEIHEFLKEKFLQPSLIEIGDDARAYYSTKNLSTTEMSDYMEQIRAWAITELGFEIPVLAEER